MNMYAAGQRAFCLLVALPRRFLKSQKKQMMMEMIKWVSWVALRVSSIMRRTWAGSCWFRPTRANPPAPHDALIDTSYQ